MAFVINTDNMSNPNPPGSGVTFHGSWGGANPDDFVEYFFSWGYGDAGADNTPGGQAGPGSSGSFADGVSPIDKDRVVSWRAHGSRFGGDSDHLGSISNDKTLADAATAATPTVSAITANSATIACTFDPKVVDSTFSVTMQYKRLVDSTWITAGAAQTTGTSISRDLTGLLGSTVYQFKMVGTRTTFNATTWESAVVSFQTLADAATVTTEAATTVTSSSALLNGTVDRHGVSNVSVYLAWGTADGGAVRANWQHQDGPLNYDVGPSGPQPFADQISGLSQNTTYFFRAFAEWP
jgi:hypothetical protein